MDDLEALARRAVACKGWRWVRGMRERGHHHLIVSVTGHYVVEVWQPGLSGASPFHVETWMLPPHNHGRERLPDFTDPATLGCLLALVREVSGDPLAHPYPLAAGGWACWFGCVYRSGTTEAEAMIAALEAIAEHAALVAALEAAPC